MKLETYLQAMLSAHKMRYGVSSKGSPYKRWRQYLKFRDRIIRMDERKNIKIIQLEGQLKLYQEWLRSFESTWDNNDDAVYDGLYQAKDE